MKPDYVYKELVPLLACSYTYPGEPDAVQLASELPAIALRHTFLGHWCGYVGVSHSSPFYGVADDDNNYNNLVSNLEVHFGVTFSGFADDFDALVGVKHLWWIGFDCAHYLDHCLYPEAYLDKEGSYKDLNYVLNELQGLVNQILQVRELTQ